MNKNAVVLRQRRQSLVYKVRQLPLIWRPGLDEKVLIERSDLGAGLDIGCDPWQNMLNSASKHVAESLFIYARHSLYPTLGMLEDLDGVQRVFPSASEKGQAPMPRTARNLLPSRGPFGEKTFAESWAPGANPTAEEHHVTGFSTEPQPELPALSPTVLRISAKVSDSALKVIEAQLGSAGRTAPASNSAS
jgi:hypothetical protein